MFGWLKNLFGGSPPAARPATPRPPIKPVAPKPEERAPEPPAAKAQAPAQAPRAVTALSPEAREFFAALAADQSSFNYQDFSLSDRAFLASVIRKSNDGDLAIPVLPEAALRIQGLLAQPNVDLGQFVEVFRTDPSLSAELLKVANSAYYGFPTPTHDLSQGILRVGFNQIRAIVVMAALRSKVLQGRYFRDEVEWITELSLATARACQDLARDLKIEGGEAFTRGLLCRVECFVLLGMAAEHMAQQSIKNPVTKGALSAAIHRMGPSVTKLIAKKWGLPMLAAPTAEEDPAAALTRRQVDAVSRVMTQAWGGLETDYAVEGLSPDKVQRVVQSTLDLASAD